MKKSKLPQILLAATLVLPLGAMAEEGMPPPGGHPGPQAGHERSDMPPPMGGPGLPFLHGLELSESQQDKLFQLTYAEAPYLREQHKAHEKAMRALHEMALGDKFDEAAAAKLAQAAAQAQANILLQHVRTHQKVLALLTPEQRKQVQERAQQHPRPPFMGGRHEH